MAVSFTARHCFWNCRVVRQRLQLAELVEVAQPALADFVGDELGEGRIADRDEPARGDAVGDVAELLRPELGEVAHHRLLEQLGVEPRDAVDAVAADGGEIGHAHIPRAALVNERHARHAALIAREAGADLVEEAPVDFADDLQVAGEQLAEQADGPFLQRFGQEGMVGVGEGVPRHVPGRVPVHLVFIHQQAHHLGHGNGRMRVVELDGPFLVELVQRAFQQQVDADHVLQRAAREEELLLEAQGLALEDLIVRVEDLGDVLRMHLVLDGAVVIAVVEGGEIERLDRLGLPEPEMVAGADAVAENRRVIGHAHDDGVRDPAHAVMPLFIGPRLGAAAELHLVGDFGPGDLPRVAEAQPLVGDLHLPAVLDGLVEDAELVADAVADGRHFERGHRIQVTRREPAQAAVAEAGLLLLLDKVVEVHAEFLHRLARILGEAQAEELAGQVRPGQELRREVGHHARVLLGVGFHRSARPA